jgi:hypothetical protein
MEFPHMVINEDGSAELLILSATAERLYDRLLEEPYQIVSLRALAETIGLRDTKHVGSHVGHLRVILEEKGIGTITNRHSHGYMLTTRTEGR